jgi:hypothetical protein
MFIPAVETPPETSQITNPLYASSEIASLFREQEKLKLQHTGIFTDIHESWDSYISGPRRKVLDGICGKFFIPRIALTGFSIDNELREHYIDHTSFFDVLVSSGGTRIDLRYKDENGSEMYVEDTEYEDFFLKQSAWNKTVILEQSKELIAAYKNKYPARELKFQKENGGTEPYRIGFHFFASSLDERNDMHTAITSLFPQAKIVVAEDRGYNAGLRLDQWPRRFCMDIAVANKLDAANYLIKRLHINTGIAVGNATNDLDFMLYTPYLMPILVGGSTIDAQTIIHAMQIEKNNHDPFITLQIKPGIYKRGYVERDQTKIANRSISHVMELLAKATLKDTHTPQLKSYLQRLVADLETSHT